ncbi:MAG TPA: class I SAM-dependent methyltransferase [Candidatus Wallbacteria bacterium]|nr:class I SAM-dependent methyltransferase [Candidatus Wallbacteria bacterium]
MPTWNELFLNEQFIEVIPQPAVFHFIKDLQAAFPGRRLKIWDQCCGAGRHSILAAKMGCDVYASDVSENGIAHLKKMLGAENLTANLEISDMTMDPWKDERFHGVICWDAIHHNTLKNVEKAIEIIYDRLVEGGMFIASIISAGEGALKKGREIEKNTFVRDEGDESGVPHHFFDEAEIKRVFKKWKKVALLENVVRHVEVDNDFYRTNPFFCTKWYALVKK